jgi:hypothetical protein
MFAPVAKITDTLSPSSVAARFQIGSHNGLYLIRTDAVLVRNLTKVGVIGQRHFYDFADLGRDMYRCHNSLLWPNFGVMIGMLPVANLYGRGRTSHCNLGCACFVQRM